MQSEYLVSIGARRLIADHRKELQDVVESHVTRTEDLWNELVFELAMKFGEDEELVNQALLECE